MAAPRLQVRSLEGDMLRLRLCLQVGGRTRLPERVAGVELWYAVGEVMPGDPDLWKRWGARSRCRFEVEVPLDARTGEAGGAGTRVWWVARWLSPLAEAGPWGKATCGYTRHMADGGLMLGVRGRRAA